jgi:hypothetical protein
MLTQARSTEYLEFGQPMTLSLARLPRTATARPPRGRLARAPESTHARRSAVA